MCMCVCTCVYVVEDFEFQRCHQLACVYKRQIGHIMCSFHTTLALGLSTAMATCMHAWNYKFIMRYVYIAELLIITYQLVRGKQYLWHPLKITVMHNV